jgi:hypothetical protein
MSGLILAELPRLAYKPSPATARSRAPTRAVDGKPAAELIVTERAQR